MTRLGVFHKGALRRWPARALLGIEALGALVLLTHGPVAWAQADLSNASPSLAYANQALGELSLEQLLDMPVTVASKTEMKASEAPSIVTVIPRSRIVSMGYRTVAEALREVPGFFVIDDLVTANVAVRGVHAGPDSWSRVIKVMVNGHPATFGETGGTLLGSEFLPIETVESIEVIRGTGSALYGANAFLGVVNVVTRRPDGPGIAMQADAEIGSVNDHWSRTGQVQATVAYGDKGESFIALSLRAEQTDRSGLLVPDSSPNELYDGGRTEGDRSKPKSAFVQGRLDLGRLGALEAQYQLQILDAFAEFSSISVLSHGNRDAMRNEIVGLDHRLSLLDDALKVHTYGTLSFGSHSPDERLDVGATTYAYRRERVSENILAGTETSYTLWGHTALVGFEYQDLKDSGDTLYMSIDDDAPQNASGQVLHAMGVPTSYRDYAVFAQLIAVPFDGLGLTAGVRHDWNEAWGNLLNYRLAATYRIIEGLSAKAVFGTSFLPPAPAQVQANPMGTGGGFIGNPDLKSQQATTGELQLTYKYEDLFEVAVDGFYTEIKNRVEYMYNGAQLVARNVAATRSMGAEVSGRIAWRPLFASVSASYQRTTPTSSPEYQPVWWKTLYGEGAGGDTSLYCPMWMGRLDVGVTEPRWYLEGYASASYVGARKSSMMNIMQNRESYLLPGYVLVSLTIKTLGVELISHRETTLSLRVNNLFDTSYAEAGYLGADIPGMPRSAYLLVSQEF